MIVPRLNEKSYGAVHVDNYIEFVGFAKNVDDKEITVDIYMDDKLLANVNCNLYIKKIDDIYECGEHCFKFLLSDEYFSTTHSLNFKVHEDDVELMNTPITTMSQQSYILAKLMYILSMAKEVEIKKENENIIATLNIQNKSLDEKEFQEKLLTYINENDNKLIIFYILDEEKKDIEKNISILRDIDISYVKLTKIEDIYNIKEFILPKNLKFELLETAMKKSKITLTRL